MYIFFCLNNLQLKMIRFLRETFLVVILIASVAAKVQNCNTTCGTGKSAKSVQYPFGFSDGCGIRLNCSESSNRNFIVQIRDFTVQNITSNSIFLNLPAKCGRRVQSIARLFGPNFGPTWNNSLLLLNCSNPQNACLIPAEFVKNQFNVESCRANNENISCFSQENSGSEILSYDYLNRTQCKYLFGSIAFHSGTDSPLSFEFETIELGWWVSGSCNCADNATCTTPKLGAEKLPGFRCQCDEGYYGDGFKNGSGCRRVSECSASRYMSGHWGRTTRVGVLIAGILSAMLLVTSIWILILCRKKNVGAATETTFFPQLLWRRVSYQELLRATDGFNVSNLLGTGGFGSVYKGTLSDGLNVAIKVFNLELEGAFTSFEVECEMLTNVRHRNLVKVISCCSQIDFKALVLNYMPNGSLEKWLYAPNFTLNIMQRLNIMTDVASALEYLHHDYETPIVHCDLKPTNILLGDDMVAHVADFGISKLLGGGDSMTRTMTFATIGYIAPEYGMEGIVTRRGDVYTFGVVLMETFTRRKPTEEIFIGEMSLKQWVANALSVDAIVEVVDTNLLGTKEDHDFMSKRECFSSVMRLAIACSAESPKERINMQEALATLKKIKIKFLKDVTGGGVVLNRHLVQ